MAIQNVEALVQQGFRIPVAVLGGKTATKIGEKKLKELLKKNKKKPISLIHSEEVEDFLAHYGVLGMRWGVHKQQERQASFERRAKKYEAKAKRIESQIKSTQSSNLRSDFKAQQISMLRIRRDQALKDAQAKRQGKLSSVQKKWLIGGGTAAALIAAYATYQVANSGEFHRSAVRGKSFLIKEKPTFKTDLGLSDPNLDADGIFEKIVKKVNPSYGGFGTKQNCRRCTFAYEMRRRGFDVQATRTTNAYGQTAGGLINAMTPNKEFTTSSRPGVIRRLLTEHYKKQKNPLAATPFTDAINRFHKGIGERGVHPEAIFKELGKMPNGARGELGVKWGIGGAHSLAWEIVKGKPVVFDTQSGKKYASAAQLFAGFASQGIADAGITRLDNIPLNHDFLLRWLKNA